MGVLASSASAQQTGDGGTTAAGPLVGSAEADPCKGVDEDDLQARLECLYPREDHGRVETVDRDVVSKPVRTGIQYAVIRVTYEIDYGEDQSCRWRDTDTWRLAEQRWAPLDTADAESKLNTLVYRKATQQAQKAAERLVEDDPLSVAARIRWAEALALDSRPSEARRKLSEAADIDPKNSRIQLFRLRISGQPATARRRLKAIPSDTCMRSTAFFNAVTDWSGTRRLEALRNIPSLPEDTETLLRSTGLAQAGKLDALREFLTPDRVLAAYRAVRDEHQSSDYRRNWALMMAVLVGHVYGASVATRWADLAKEADADNRGVRALSDMFTTMRYRDREQVPEQVVDEVFSSGAELL
jgi:tetratricopeptide (TPR) repeat protein